MRCSERVFLSMYDTPETLPSGPLSSSRAIANGMIFSRPVFKASGIITWLELNEDAVWQPCVHCAQ